MKLRKRKSRKFLNITNINLNLKLSQIIWHKFPKETRSQSETHFSFFVLHFCIYLLQVFGLLVLIFIFFLPPTITFHFQSQSQKDNAHLPLRRGLKDVRKLFNYGLCLQGGTGTGTGMDRESRRNHRNCYYNHQRQRLYPPLVAYFVIVTFSHF